MQGRTNSLDDRFGGLLPPRVARSFKQEFRDTLRRSPPPLTREEPVRTQLAVLWSQRIIRINSDARSPVGLKVTTFPNSHDDEMSGEVAQTF